MKFTDLGMKIAVPYNHDPELLAVIERYKDAIYTIYCPPPPDVMFSGDVTQSINWKIYEAELINTQKQLAPWDISISILYNVTSIFDPSIYHNFTSCSIYRFAKNMIDAGITTFVVADIYLAKTLKQYFPDIVIEVSLNAFINTIKKAIHWIDEVDPRTFCIAEDMNKDLAFIRDLKTVTSKPLKMLVNSRCQVDCPNAQTHANLLSVGYPSSPYMCGSTMAKKPWLMYRGNAVVPYNLRHYVGLIDYIKFIGRTQPTYIIERDLQLYVDQVNSRAYSPQNGVINIDYQHYDDLGEYIVREIAHPYLKEEPKDIFEKVSTCDNNCQICNWCFERWCKDWNITEKIDPNVGIEYPYDDPF